MSHKASDWAYSQNVPSKAKFVLTTFADQANDGGEVCYQRTDVQFFVKKLNMPERSFYHCVAALVRNGYVGRKNTRGSKDPEYWLCIDREPTPISEWSWRAEKAEDSSESQDDSDTTSGGSATIADLESDPKGLPPLQNSLPPLQTTHYSKKPLYKEAGRERAVKALSRLPQGIAAVPAVPDERIPVIKGTRWWTKMEDYWKRTRGRRWQKDIPLTGEHAGKTGWYFRKADVDAALKRPDGVDDEAAAEFAQVG